MVEEISRWGRFVSVCSKAVSRVPCRRVSNLISTSRQIRVEQHFAKNIGHRTADLSTRHVVAMHGKLLHKSLETVDYSRVFETGKECCSFVWRQNYFKMNLVSPRATRAGSVWIPHKNTGF